MGAASEPVTTRQAAEEMGVEPETIRSWVHRGHLAPVTGPGGQPVRHPDTGEHVYWLLDVARAELATRARARRTLRFWRIKRLYHLERMDAAI
jgi:MerR HTH family regulatory protein